MFKSFFATSTNSLKKDVNPVTGGSNGIHNEGLTNRVQVPKTGTENRRSYSDITMQINKDGTVGSAGTIWKIPL